MILPIDQTATSADTALPAYTSAGAPAPRYSPKKDFGKAFAELQGRYGYDGAAPLLISSDNKPKTSKMPKDRSNSDSSTDSNRSLVKSFKRFVSRSPTPSKQSSTTAVSSSSVETSRDAKVEADVKDDMKNQTAGVQTT